MNKDKLTERIMDTLEEQNISPKPRWEFLLKNAVLWSVGGVAVLVGGVASAVIIFALRNSDIAMRMYLSDGLFHHIIAVAPFMWIGALVLFLGVALYNIRHTKRGYRYHPVILAGGSVLVSICIGSVLYAAGMAHVIDVRMGQFVPLYKGVEQHREEMWVQEDRGMLAGYVIATSSDGFVLKDFKDRQWSVSREKLNEIDDYVVDTLPEVGIVGTVTGTATFEACGVRPWGVAGADENVRAQIRALKLANPERASLQGEAPKPMQGEGFGKRMHGQKEGLAPNERKLSELRTIECEGLQPPHRPEIKN